jgi:hypothetical protein
MTFHLSKEQIAETAGELDAGQKCYVHTGTGAMVFYPDPSQFPVEDDDTWQDAIREVAQNPKAYLEIERMPSREGFRVMQAFANQMAPPALREKLLRALSLPSPFQQFKREIDHSGDYRQEWFTFKQEQMIDWVQRRLAEGQH